MYVKKKCFVENNSKQKTENLKDYVGINFPTNYLFIPISNKAAKVAHFCFEAELVEITEESLAVSVVVLVVQTA